MTVVALQSKLAAQLDTEARRRQTSVDALVNDWLEDQLWHERRRQIYEEAERFRARHAELLLQYGGQYIAMRNGVVIDHDPELLALHGRIRAQYGDDPVLITPVTTEPVQTLKVRGVHR
ncbi:MAG: hypothetical protein AUK03_10415 [Anaerolineae bacterium CG2_30_64_16]|nr:MAG: hypothetical protein AUK03_10415 [Anaerolineae bacterium CG2_30_64_16]